MRINKDILEELKSSDKSLKDYTIGCFENWEKESCDEI